ncbi:hypothetical protein [Maribacter sp. 2304DJ31-5]|uniref:hypothetical protein n=1 Tax=Maribacter sp. 2304DJ31-5 TaxID=3386273 RepID=UPI0039BD1DE8
MLSTFFLFSCSTDDGMESTIVDLQFSSQKWQLVRMTGSFAGSVSEGENMEWQEFYIFDPDGTFLKSRDRDGITTEATGTFEAVEYENDDHDYLELTYKTSELIGNCSGNNKEILIYRSSRRLSNTWQACDGPGLDYTLTED